MTFTEREINAIEIDMDAEWIYDDERKKCVVDFWPGSFIRDKVLAFLNIDLDNVYTDMWLDATAMIDPKERVVTELFFDVPLDQNPNDDAYVPTELDILITNFPEGRRLFDRLMITSGGGLEEFIKECI
jgi:hypothetical protein